MSPKTLVVLVIWCCCCCSAYPKYDDTFSNDVIDPEAGKALKRPITLTIPTVPLQFRNNVKKKPKKKNLHSRRLLRKMGPDFDPVWMAVEPPSVEETQEMNPEQIAQIVEQVSGLDLDLDLQEIIGETTEGLDQMVSVFQQWLVKKSSCPVTYRWNDLGEYFWPRYVKTGSCDSTSKSCSWPRGMKCVQNEVQPLNILRWHCRRRKKSKRSRRHRCQWYKVPYPVTSSCKCACQ